jgi:hypothetical protein
MTHGSSAGGFSSVPVLSERIDEIAGAFVGKEQVPAVDFDHFTGAGDQVPEPVGPGQVEKNNDA